MRKKLKKVCIVTGTRAEYGLLFWLMKSIKEDSCLDLQIIATGSHLSPEFGLTYQEIEKDGFTINKKIEMILSADTPSAITKSTGIALISFADSYLDLMPDAVVLLGDRYELLAASTAALFAGLPIVHIHGGETTVGAFDEAIRHSITKMAWWHFTATEEYQKRVVQLGENPDRVFNVGGLGVDYIKKANLLSKKQLMSETKIQFAEKNLLVTYHPVTMEKESSERDFGCLLEVLAEFDDIYLIFTMPNSDTNGRIIQQMIQDFVSTYPKRTIAFSSMGNLNYLSTMQFVDGVVGNSSSGLLETPTYQIGTINIGDRQKGRLKAKSVIDCVPSIQSIKDSINKLYCKEFQRKLKGVINPYGNGDASEKILDVLKKEYLPKNLKKNFHDLR